jgi:hypothetical protein
MTHLAKGKKMNPINTPTGKRRIVLTIEALKIAVNHYEFEGEFNKVEELTLLIQDMENN